MRVWAGMVGGSRAGEEAGSEGPLRSAEGVRPYLGGFRPYLAPVALGLIGLGLLSQRMGAVPFFGGFGLLLLLVHGLPGLAGLLKKKAAPVTTTAATALVFFFAAGMARGAETIVPAESMNHTWRIVDGRLNGEIAKLMAQPAR